MSQALGQREFDADLSVRLRRQDINSKPAREVILGGLAMVACDRRDTRVLADLDRPDSAEPGSFRRIWEPEFETARAAFCPDRRARCALGSGGYYDFQERTRTRSRDGHQGVLQSCLSRPTDRNFSNTGSRTRCVLRTIHRFLKAGVMGRWNISSQLMRARHKVAFGSRRCWQISICTMYSGLVVRRGLRKGVPIRYGIHDKAMQMTG